MTIQTCVSSCSPAWVAGSVPAPISHPGRSQDITGENFVGNRAPHEGPDGARQHFFHGFTALHRDISLIRKPTIAMINGPAVGSGMDMALHCDIRIGCEKTRFIAYHNAGQIIENGGSYYLPKMVGLGRALEFAYTGELNAERAYEWGMLNHLVPSEKLEETTRELCEKIIARPPLVQWVSKRVMRAALDSTLETTMVLTSNAGGILQNSDDAKEARRAFVEKAERPLQGRLTFRAPSAGTPAPPCRCTAPSFRSPIAPAVMRLNAFHSSV